MDEFIDAIHDLAAESGWARNPNGWGWKKDGWRWGRETRETEVRIIVQELGATRLDPFASRRFQPTENPEDVLQWIAENAQ